MLAKDSEKLIKFVSDLAGDRFLKVEKDLGAGFFRLKITEAEKRQARHDIRHVEDCVIELLRNARDAGAKRVFVSTAKVADNWRCLRIIDDGNGIPDHVHNAVFEPRVTSKLDAVIEDRYGVHGRGMALYSIKTTAEDVKLVSSAPGLGSVFSLNVCLDKLGERVDQSTFPRISKVKKKTVIKGPHNILRATAEFVLDHPEISLFVGSPAEIMATMIKESKREAHSLLPIDNIPYYRRLARVRDANELADMGIALFDIKISERNAHRVMGAEIEPVQAINSLILQHTDGHQRKESHDIYITDNNLTKNISQDDLKTFTQAIKQNFRHLGEKYFIKIDGEPEIKRSRRKITITLPINADQEY